MLITVTVDDIRNGVAGSCARCPVALAIARTLRVRVHVKVSGYVVAFTNECRRLAYIATPVAAELFIRRFDRGESVQPFSFELPLTAGQVAALEVS